jgi:methionyl-tRNA formyltransferase
MSMVEAMDAGPWLAQQKTAIAPNDTAVTLREKLAQASAVLLRTSLPTLLSNNYILTPQNEAEATYCKKISKADGCLNFSKSAILLERCIRAYQPWPGTYFLKNNERYLVHRAHVMTDSTANETLLFPTVSASTKDKTAQNKNRTNQTYGQFLTDPNRTVLAVTTEEGLFVIDRIQKAGGKPMNAAEFLRGNRSFSEA